MHASRFLRRLLVLGTFAAAVIAAPASALAGEYELYGPKKSSDGQWTYIVMNDDGFGDIAKGPTKRKAKKAAKELAKELEAAANSDMHDVCQTWPEFCDTL